MTLKDRAREAGGSAATLAEIIGDLPVDRVSRVAGLARGTLRYQLRAALTCRHCDRLCRHPRRFGGGLPLRHSSRHRQPGARLVWFPGERGSHQLWVWSGPIARWRIRRAS